MSYFTPQQINQFFPVIGIIKYNGGVIVRRGCTLNLNQARYLHERKKITVVSKRSLNKLALLVRGCGITFQSLMTLTYGQNYPLSGRKAKKDLNHFLVASKRFFGPYQHIWVLEFQDRGAVHFHIATTLPPPTTLEREVFARIWADISTRHNWLYRAVKFDEGVLVQKNTLLTRQAVFENHMRDRHWEVVKNRDSLHRYFAKYCTKIRQKKVPEWYGDVGRFWAASEGVRLPDGQPFHGSENDVRELAGQFGRNLDGWDVLPKVLLLG